MQAHLIWDLDSRLVIVMRLLACKVWLPLLLVKLLLLLLVILLVALLPPLLAHVQHPPVVQQPCSQPR